MNGSNWWRRGGGEEGGGGGVWEGYGYKGVGILMKCHWSQDRIALENTTKYSKRGEKATKFECKAKIDKTKWR